MEFLGDIEELSLYFVEQRDERPSYRAHGSGRLLFTFLYGGPCQYLVSDTLQENHTWGL